MTVQVTDVRIALNSISEEELSSLTIQQKIADATAKADDNSMPVGVKRENFIRDWAAWRSFIVSKSYSLVQLGDIRLQKDIEAFAEKLKQIAEEALEQAVASGGPGSVTSTPMFDERPKDPYDLGDLGGVP